MTTNPPLDPGARTSRYVCTVTGEPHPLPDETHESQDFATAVHHDRGANTRLLNQLRAGVLGANDGIVSVGGLVVGVAGASTSTPVLMISGIAAVVSGALSMAMGEYVSVSTQRDSEKSLVERVREQLADNPKGEHWALVDSFEEKGIPTDLADEVSDRLTENDVLGAHLAMRYSMDEHTIVSPIAAALASLVAFTIGALIPLLAILFAPVSLRVPMTIGAVVIALALTGFISSKLGESQQGKATVRTIIGGVLALLVGWGVGSLAGSLVPGEAVLEAMGSLGSLVV